MLQHHVNPITELVNKAIGQPVLHLLEQAGFHPHDKTNPIPDYVVMSVIVTVVIVGLALLLKRRLSVDRPGAAQQIAELLMTNPLKMGLRDLLDENAGHHGRQYMSMVGTVAVFILVSNLISVFPIFVSPTAAHPVPFACAVVTFCYFNWQGIRAHGALGYLKHFCGPVWWLSPLIFVVEIISTTLRLLSLTVRLWANMLSSELIYVIFLGLLMQPAIYFYQKLPAVGIALGIFPATIPIAFVLLHVFVAVMQTFVFTLLPSVYLGMATSHEH